MTPFNSFNWVAIKKHGSAYRIFSNSLVVAPLDTKGSVDYEALADVSKDAFTEEELPVFLADIEQETGWRHGEHFQLQH